jgi:hypothetical protein
MTWKEFTIWIEQTCEEKRTDKPIQIYTDNFVERQVLYLHVSMFRRGQIIPIFLFKLGKVGLAVPVSLCSTCLFHFVGLGPFLVVKSIPHSVIRV